MQTQKEKTMVRPTGTESDSLLSGGSSDTAQRSWCGIRNRDTYISEINPPFKSTDQQIQDKTARGNGSPP